MPLQAKGRPSTAKHGEPQEPPRRNNCHANLEGQIPHSSDDNDESDAWSRIVQRISPPSHFARRSPVEGFVPEGNSSLKSPSRITAA